MPEAGYPSVYTVDTHTTTRPPVPPRLSQRRQRTGVAQTLLFLLVSLALCGMVIEAFLIYRLYKSESDTSASSSMQIADKDTPTKIPRRDVLPSKPVAHLTDGQDAHHKKQIMAWSTAADPLLYEMDYKDGSIIIQREGYYYVYTKVSFFDNHAFNHSVHVKTNRYKGKSIALLVSRANADISKGKEIKDNRSNSYLGGVFHLYENDALFVKVSNTSQIARYKYCENIFGAYMI
uniref:tumor necrosis factor ligand superfamily member 14 n=1 Tax=Semicossyphus pulcher TaxID=241346 RepID=UPI0037E95A82